tara:strand:- start:1008 stop:1190 length:183 start_codon:yes stop_codon:yes gene_type:complete
MNANRFNLTEDGRIGRFDSLWFQFSLHVKLRRGNMREPTMPTDIRDRIPLDRIRSKDMRN